MEKYFKDKQKWIIGLCAAQILFIFINFIVAMVTYSGASAYLYFIEIFNFLITAGLFGFAIINVLRQDTFWCKTLFIIYFSYIFLSSLFSFYINFSFFSGGNGGIVWYGILEFFSALAVVLIGFAYILGLNKANKNEKVVDILIYVRLGILLVLFLTVIILLATKTLSGGIVTVINVLAAIVLTLLFYVCTKFEEFKTSKELETDNTTMENGSTTTENEKTEINNSTSENDKLEN